MTALSELPQHRHILLVVRRQVRRARKAAQRRLTEAQTTRALARMDADREAREKALRPWAAEIAAERVVAPLTPKQTAQRLRQIAKEMTSVARALRREAKQLDEQAS